MESNKSSDSIIIGDLNPTSDSFVSDVNLRVEKGEEKKNAQCSIKSCQRIKWQ